MSYRILSGTSFQVAGRQYDNGSATTPPATRAEWIAKKASQEGISLGQAMDQFQFAPNDSFTMDDKSYSTAMANIRRATREAVTEYAQAHGQTL